MGTSVIVSTIKIKKIKPKTASFTNFMFGEVFALTLGCQWLRETLI